MVASMCVDVIGDENREHLATRGGVQHRFRRSTESVTNRNESSIGFIGDLVLDYVVNGRMTQPAGNAHPLWAPHGISPARGEDQWVAIAAHYVARSFLPTLTHPDGGQCR
jgi:hypothetical protein